MKDKTSIIEKAAEEFKNLTQKGDRTNRYTKDRRQRKKERIAGQVANKYSIKKDFFVLLVAHKNYLTK